MIAIDTNVLVRIIIRDDPAQVEQTDRIVDEHGAEGIFISQIVLAELAWVLRRAYRMDAATILAAIEGVLEAREFVVDRTEMAQTALVRAKQTGCGFADALIEGINLAAGAQPTYTFDRRAGRLTTMRTPGVST